MSASVRIAVSWERRMLKSGKKFARLTTNRAVYDRVAVIDDLTHKLVIQWLKGTSKKRNLNSANCSNEVFTVKTETISQTDVQDLRFYKN